MPSLKLLFPIKNFIIEKNKHNNNAYLSFPVVIRRPLDVQLTYIWSPDFKGRQRTSDTQWVWLVFALLSDTLW